MNDNPYSPPLSADFRQPENNPNYQPTKKQSVARIALSAFVFALSFTLLCCLVALIRLFWEYPVFFQQTSNVVMFVSWIIEIFMVAMIVGLIFSILTECRFNKIKNKYFYILTTAFFIIVLYIFIFPIFYATNFNNYLYFLVLMITDKQTILELTYSSLILIISLGLSFSVFSKHRKYYSNLSGSLK
ncbi:MAG: hypothetical protein IJ143_03970 [Neisseriaceae bacterium]|nr:hypothetical protein [Neisseriaceae bacterium]